MWELVYACYQQQAAELQTIQKHVKQLFQCWGETQAPVFICRINYKFVLPVSGINVSAVLVKMLQYCLG